MMRSRIHGSWSCLRRNLTSQTPVSSHPYSILVSSSSWTLQNSWRLPHNPANPRISATPSLSALSASFSTSLRLQAPGDSKHQIKGKIKKNYKKSQQSNTNTSPPLPGERKAFRKRLQLSNSNAIAVHGFSPLEPDSLAQEAQAGKVLSLKPELIDQLRELSAFKPNQKWGLFRNPHTLIRSESVQLGQKMTRAAASKTTVRSIVSGERFVGKSVFLIQAISHALLNKWIVFHFPEGQELTNAQTEYSPVPQTNPLLFYQPVYSLKFLQATAKANEEVLSSIPVSRDYSQVAPNLSHLRANASLFDLAYSCKESEFAWPTLQVLWQELVTIPGRPPVLLTLDGLSHVMRLSKYRDPAFNQVHSFDLTLVRLFVDALAGKTSLLNGGAVIATTGGNNHVKVPSLDLYLAQQKAKAELALLSPEERNQVRVPSQYTDSMTDGVPEVNPFEKGYDRRVEDVLRSLSWMELAGVTKTEARSLLEYWAASGIFRERVTEEIVGRQWSMGGSGILGEMERSSLLHVRV